MADVLFEVEKIVDGPNDRQEFFIKWDGYPDSQNTWEPLENLPEDMVDEYLNEIEREEEAEAAANEANAAKAAQKGRKKRQRIPGVEIAQVVNPNLVQLKEPLKLPKIPKGLGRSSVLQVGGRFLYPQAPLRIIDPNDYLKKVYQMVVTGWGRQRIKNENAYVLQLEPGPLHDGIGLGHSFYCRFAHAKITTPCPPNQAFKVSDFTQTKASDAEEAASSSSDDDDEPSSDSDSVDDTTSDERPVWETKTDGTLKFREEMSTCWRKVAEPSSLEHPPSLCNAPDPCVHKAEWFAEYFFPMLWWKHDV